MEARSSKDAAIRELDASFRGRNLGSGIRTITIGEVVDDSEVRTNPDVDANAYEAQSPGMKGWKRKDWLLVIALVAGAIGVFYLLLKKGIIRV